MAVEFRCEKCGKLLNVDAEPGSTVKCPHCGKKAAVPAILASLPHPQVTANLGPEASAAPPPTSPPADGEPPPEEQPPEEGEDVLMGTMAKIMPWVISVFLHVGVALIMMFVSMVVVVKNIPDDVIVPDAVFSDDPGGNPNPGEGGNPNLEARQNKVKVDNATGYSSRESSVPAGEGGKTDKKIQLIGVGGGGGGAAGGSLAPYGLTTGGGSGSGPKSNFFGHGGNVYHVVYVIDRSGSMIDTFDYVRHEMLVSISRLRPIQDFHVILFAAGAPLENGPKRLVNATPRNKEEAAKFLEPIRAEGQTDPIPALNRAFDVLGQADPNKKGKLVYLLTDGVFPDNAKVIDAITHRNTKKDVHINTYLYGNKPVEAVKVMTDIANGNGGRYKYVSQDE